VPEAIEGSLMLASHALALVEYAHAPGDPDGAGRDARYNLLRGYFAAQMTRSASRAKPGGY
jgi:hypothetical protein